jgi:uncharacterized protein YejL (UPF0352 family)
MQNITGYSVSQLSEVRRDALNLLANVRWGKVLADLGLLVVGLMTCSLLSSVR